jgi:type VI secretion system secreted protein VgrG
VDTTTWPEIRRFLTGESVRQLLPHLGEDFEIFAPGTRAYNCIAHSLGRADEWINPETGPPDNLLLRMDQRYTAAGFTRLSSLRERDRRRRQSWWSDGRGNS